jgi:hypothetical protein
MKISRKDFLKAGAAIATSAIALQACGDDDESTATGPTSTSTGGSSSSSTSGMGGSTGCTTCATPNATIGTNHGHTITVTVAEVMAAAAVTYDIMGTSVHTHMVTVTAADFTTLQTCGSVMVTSTDSMHTHVVTVTCAG